jgi:hypothetical protein
MSEPVYIIVDSVQLEGKDADLQSNNAVSKSYVDSKVSTAVAALVDSAPQALDTLKEIASALGNDANLASTLITSIGVVQASVTTEAGVRSSADTTLEGKVATEAKRAGDAEIALGARVDTEVADRVAAVSDLSTLLQEESSSRVADGLALGVRIDDEKKVSSDAIVAEAKARADGDSVEAVARASADSAEAAARESADSAEAAVRASADSAEATAREAADSLKFDKTGGSVSGEVTLDSYLNFGTNWRVKASSDGSRIVFQHKKADGSWKDGIPFISRT